MAALIREEAPHVVVVTITGSHDENLRADPELLRATLLPCGWDDDEFDPTGFCAHDLCVECA